MNTPDMQKIIDRINKLQNLANDPAASESEIEQATRHIQNLLDKYNLSIEAIKPVTVAEIGQFSVPNASNNRINEWERFLVQTIAENFYCTTVFYSYKWVFIGTKHDSEIAIQTFNTVRNLLLKLATGNVAAYTQELFLVYGVVDTRQLKGSASLKAYRNSYLLGAVSGLAQQLKANRQNADQQTTALVLTRDAQIEEAKNNFFPKLRTVSARESLVNGSAYEKGRSDGNNLKWHKELPNNDHSN